MTDLPVLFFLGLLLSVLIAAMISSNKKQNNISKQTVAKLSSTPTSPPNPSRTDTGDGSYTIATNIPKQRRFVSPKLGISFLYISANPVEVGNKVSLDKGYPDPSIEVFQKNSHDSLASTIQKDFLQGYSENDCIIKNMSMYYKNYRYETAVIDVPHHAVITPQEVFEESKKCTTPYTRANYESYFAYDNNHSGKYVFIYITQWNISSGNEAPNASGSVHVTSWDQTLKFLN